MDGRDDIIRRISVLYVEDEFAPREALARFLSRRVSKVYVASSGKEGLKLFEKKATEIDLILTDIAMPEMNGIEMVENIKKINDEVSVIFLTAHSEVSYLKKSIELGADGYILKPVEYEKLINTMHKVVYRNVLRKELMKRQLQKQTN